MRNIIIVILVFVSFLGLVDVVEYDYRQYESPFIFLFALLLCLWKALALTVCWTLAGKAWRGRRKKAARAVVAAAAAVYCVLCLVNWISGALYGFGISRRLATILSQSNVREAWEYMPSLWSRVEIDQNVVIVMLILTVVAVAMQRIDSVSMADEASGNENAGENANVNGGDRQLRKEKIRLLAAAAVATVVLGTWVLLTRPNGRANYLITLRTALAIADVRKFQEEAAQMYAAKKELRYRESVENVDATDNLVLVIGESVDTRHCSLYGYHLPTNKYTSALKDPPLVMKDVISPYCGTNEVMTRLLTFEDDDPKTNAENWADYPDIVSVMKAAGFTCHWISNQQKLGNYMDCTTPIASNAAEEVWLTEYSSDNLLEQYDEALLPHLAAALKDGTKRHFVVVHLMGAHPDFKCRYPRNRSRFAAKDYAWNSRIAADDKAREVSAEYDNAVAYSDSVVAQAVKVAMKGKGRTLLLYVSDHGQNVYDSEWGFGHHENHVNVPMLLFCNDAYRQANSKILGNLEANAAKPITTANLIHALLGMAGVKYRLYDEKLDFSSGSYAPGVRYANEKPYE